MVERFEMDCKFLSKTPFDMNGHPQNIQARMRRNASDRQPTSKSAHSVVNADFIHNNTFLNLF